MLLKLTGILASALAIDLNEVTDDMIQDSHKIWDSYMEKEEPLYNWYEYEGTSIKSLHGGTIHFYCIRAKKGASK